MSALLLFLAGPMQSWGIQSRFTERDTGLEPSKSGVIGLLCAALGRRRAEPVDDLATLRMGVRVDQEGVMRRDYHTAGGGGLGIARADGSHSRDAVLSNRYYLADAQFLVGLEGSDDSLLAELHASLRSPVWQLSLGRKAFLPAVPPYLPNGLSNGLPLSETLTRYPWPVTNDLCPLRQQPDGLPRPGELRLVLELQTRETPQPTDIVEERMDQPFGASFHTRRFYSRRTVTRYIPIPTPQEA